MANRREPIQSRQRGTVREEVQVAALDGLIVGTYIKNHNKAAKWHKYHLTDEKRMAAEAVGITTVDGALPAHGHAFSKLLEIYIWTQEIPRMTTGDVTLLTIKEEKAEQMAELLQKEVRLTQQVITVRDMVRYKKASRHTPSAISTSEAILHDSLMYLTPLDVYKYFEDNPNLQTMIATLVVAPEQEEYGCSLYPDLYKFKIQEDKVVHAPDGCWREAYTQPREAHKWLRRNQIVGRLGPLNIEVLRSIYDHHVLYITRRPALPNTQLTFETPGLIMLPKIQRPTPENAELLFPKHLASATFKWMLSVRGLQAEHIAARMRVIASDNRYDVEVENFANAVVVMSELAKEIEKATKKTRINFGIKKWTKRLTGLEVVEKLMDNVHGSRFSNLIKLMMTKETTYVIERQAHILSKKDCLSTWWTRKLPPPTRAELGAMIAAVMTGEYVSRTEKDPMDDTVCELDMEQESISYESISDVDSGDNGGVTKRINEWASSMVRVIKSRKQGDHTSDKKQALDVMKAVTRSLKALMKMGVSSTILITVLVLAVFARQMSVKKIITRTAIIELMELKKWTVRVLKKAIDVAAAMAPGPIKTLLLKLRANLWRELGVDPYMQGLRGSMDDHTISPRKRRQMAMENAERADMEAGAEGPTEEEVRIEEERFWEELGREEPSEESEEDEETENIDVPFKKSLALQAQHEVDETWRMRKEELNLDDKWDSVDTELMHRARSLAGAGRTGFVDEIARVLKKRGINGVGITCVLSEHYALGGLTDDVEELHVVQYSENFGPEVTLNNVTYHEKRLREVVCPHIPKGMQFMVICAPHNDLARGNRAIREMCVRYGRHMAKAGGVIVRFQDVDEELLVNLSTLKRSATNFGMRRYTHAHPLAMDFVSFFEIAEGGVEGKFLEGCVDEEVDQEVTGLIQTVMNRLENMELEEIRKEAYDYNPPSTSAGTSLRTSLDRVGHKVCHCSGNVMGAGSEDQKMAPDEESGHSEKEDVSPAADRRRRVMELKREVMNAVDVDEDDEHLRDFAEAMVDWDKVESDTGSCDPEPKVAETWPAIPEAKIHMQRRNTCLFEALAKASGQPMTYFWNALASTMSEAEAATMAREARMRDVADVMVIAGVIKKRIKVRAGMGWTYRRKIFGAEGNPVISIDWMPGHWYVKESEAGVMKEVIKDAEECTPEQSLQFLKDMCTREHTPSAARAKILTRQLNRGLDCKILQKRDKTARAMHRTIEAGFNRRKVKINFTAGLPSSGKSTEIERHVKNVMGSEIMHHALLKVVTYKENLRDKLKKEIQPPDGFEFTIATWEHGLIDTGAQILVIDELGEMPPGYVDALLLYKPEVKYVIMNGDPPQAVYRSMQQDSPLNNAQPEVEYYSQYITEYKWLAHGLAKGVADAHGLATSSKLNGRIIRTTQLRAGIPTLYPSHVAARDASQSGIEAYTWKQSQGTRPKGDWQVVVTRGALDFPDRLWYVAMTRGKGNVFLVNRLGKGTDVTQAGGLAAAYMTGNGIPEAVSRHISRTLPKHVLNPLPSGGALHTKLQHLPHLTYDIPSYPSPQHTVASYPKPERKLPSYRATFSPAPEAYVDARVERDVRGKDSREIEDALSQTITDQIPENDGILGAFLRHRSTDVATVNETIRKRIVKGQELRNRMEYVAKRLAADELIAGFKRGTGIESVPWDPELFEMCREENEEKHLARPLSDLKQHAVRSDDIRPINFVSISMKNQWKKKLDAIGSMAKAGQTIACYRAQVLLQMGPLGRYMYHQLKRYSYKNLFFHNMEDEDSMATFVDEYWDFSRESDENDYTAYDQSQDGGVTGFKRRIMETFSIPEHYVKENEERCMTLRAFMGELGHQMFSGSWDTHFINTTLNVAMNHTKYNINPRTPQMYAGDDSATNEVAKVSARWKRIESMYALVSKRKLTYHPTFCGWRLVPGGIIKDPLLLYMRIKYAMAERRMGLCYASYYREFLIGMKNWGAKEDHLSEMDMDCIYLSGRYFNKLKRGKPELQGAFKHVNTQMQAVEDVVNGFDRAHAVHLPHSITERLRFAAKKIIRTQPRRNKTKPHIVPELYLPSGGSMSERRRAQAGMAGEYGTTMPSYQGNERVISMTQANAVYEGIRGELAKRATGVTDENIKAVIREMVLQMADVGTTSKTNYSSYNIKDPRAPDDATREINMGVLTAIILDRCGTIRRWARFYAEVVMNVVKSNPGTSFAVGEKAGVPADMMHVGFDFADGIPVTKLSGEEQGAIDAAKQVNLYRSAAGRMLNNAVQYTGATATRQQGNVQTNAKRITF